jgi:hypothetical protein
MADFDLHEPIAFRGGPAVQAEFFTSLVRRLTFPVERRPLGHHQGFSLELYGGSRQRPSGNRRLLLL